MGEQDKILSQHEVDALLSAIDSGEVEVGLEESQVRQATPYDFKRPERVARDQLRAIGTLHEVLARSLQTTLGGMLRTVMDLNVASVDQLTFSEFINSLPNPTVFNVVSCEPLEGNLIIEMNPTIAFPIIERLLGSRRIGGTQPERELTPIEWNLIDRILARTLELMKQAWATVVPIEFKVINRASNPQLMQIMSPNEPVVMVVLEMTMGESKGYMNLCIPVMTIEPVMEKISTHSWFVARRRGAAPGQEQRITKSLSEAEMTLVVHLPPGQVALQDLRGLKPGDLLATPHPQMRPVIISVEGRPKYRARLGTHLGRLAVRLEGTILPAEEFKLLQPTDHVTVHKGERPPAPEGAVILDDDDGDVTGLLQVEVGGSVVLADKMMKLREVIGLKPGDVIDFSKRVDEPLRLLFGGREVARGMTVKIGEKFGLQVTEIGTPSDTVRSLGSRA